MMGDAIKLKSYSLKMVPLPHHIMHDDGFRADGTKIYLPVRDEDLALYEEARDRLSTENYLPETFVRPGHNTDQARGYNYLKWKDFFNARQLLCLVLLLRNPNY
ncbi:hypothetical protein AB2F28_24175 (plasmid) [Escherichia coli]